GGQEGERERHADAEFPQIGDEHPQRAPFAAPFRRGILHRDGQGEAAVIVGHGECHVTSRRGSSVSCCIALKAPENIPEGPCRSLSGSSLSLPFRLRSPI